MTMTVTFATQELEQSVMEHFEESPIVEPVDEDVTTSVEVFDAFCTVVGKDTVTDEKDAIKLIESASSSFLGYYTDDEEFCEEFLDNFHNIDYQVIKNAFDVEKYLRNLIEEKEIARVGNLFFDLDCFSLD